MTYESLLIASDNLGLITREKNLLAYDGRIKDNRVAIRRTIPTQKKKACVLAEELGHYFTSSGDILNGSANARQQERRARLWAYDLQIGLSGLVDTYLAGCRNIYEASEYLDVPEDFLKDCLICYHEKYGSRVRYEEYLIRFDPYFEVTREYETTGRR